MRGLACIVVMLSHVGIALPLGRQAVFVFFGLSGFLITDILLRDRDRVPSLGNYWARFAWRRALRIFPIYYILIAASIALLWGMGSGLQHAPWFLIYTQDFQHSPTWEFPLWLGHTWSLAVEEQYYLVWPLAVWMLGRRWLPILCGLLIVGAALWRFEQLGQSHFHFCVVMDQLAVGSLLACVRPADGFRWSSKARLAAWPIISAVACLLVAIDKFAVWYMPSIVACTSCLAIAAAMDAPPALLTRRLIRHVGQISYGLYLWHVPVFWFLDRNDLGGMAPITLKFILTYCVALLSWRFIESPLLALKDRVFLGHPATSHPPVALQLVRPAPTSP